MQKKKTPHKKRKDLPAPKKKSFIEVNVFYILLVFIMIFTALIRIRLLNIPLERDEGEYAYFGQLILRGIPPYEAAYNMKFPGTYLIYAFFMMLFGQNVAGIHLGLLITNLATIMFVFLIAKKMISNTGACTTALVFAVLSISDSVLGFAGHATHFVTLFAVAGTFVMLRAIEKNKDKLFFLSGILFGLAPVFKQSGIFFSFFGASLFVYFLIATKKEKLIQVLKKTGIFITGGIFPSVLILILLLAWGVFDNFLFWTFEYPFAYGMQVPLERGISNLTGNFSYITNGFVLTWVLSAFGLPALFFHPVIRKNLFTKLFLLLLFLFSILTIVPGLYFRPHYFINLLPAVALSAGVAVDFAAGIKFKHRKNKIFPLLAAFTLIIVVGAGINNKSDYLFGETPDDISRRIYGLNPFIESEAVGKFIRQNTSEGDKIAVIGSEPQIYFHAQRISATGFIYMYPLMEIHDNNLSMQEQMISEIEAADPEVIVIVDISKSWLKKPGSPMKIFNWSSGIASGNKYEMIGSVELYSNTTLYKFTPVAMKNQPVSKFRIRIFKQKQ
jgi:hypothetical protein